MIITTPSRTDIKYGDTLILHATAQGPEGSRIVWSKSANYVSLSPTSYGDSCSTKGTGNGTLIVTATLVDKDGKTIYVNGAPVSDSIQINAKGCIIYRISSFFKDLLGINRVTTYML